MIMPELMGNRVGEQKYSNEGCLMKIVEYYNYDDIVVQFQDEYGYFKCTDYGSFKIGEVKNPYHKSMYGVGFMGVGHYRKQIDGVNQPQYKAWCEILRRCYAKNADVKFPTYKDSTVCETWKNLQFFGSWHDENVYTLDDEKMEIDKDWLIKGNKLYSPVTCIFVPSRINRLIGGSSNNGLPKGVKYRPLIKRFVATLNNKHLACCKTPEEAFEYYKKAKEDYIKEVALNYKLKYPQFPNRLYEAMLNYNVEITD